MQVKFEDREIVLILNTFKDILKQKHLTYADIAKKSKIPESTIKKSLASYDISFTRLGKLCTAAGISLLDLMDIARSKSTEIPVILTLEQELFFVEKPLYYLFFIKLFLEKRSLEETSKYFKLNTIEARQILAKLHKFGLLTIATDGSIQLTNSNGIRFNGDGPLMKLIVDKGLKGLLHYLTHAETKSSDSDDPFLRFSFTRVSKETYEDLIRTMKHLLQEFRERSIRERHIYNNNELFDISWIMGVAKTNALEYICDNKKNQ